MSIRKSYKLHNNPNRKVMRQAKSVSSWIRGALSLTAIMGLTWISGFFLLVENLAVANLAAYVFTVFNASQGIFIFLFHIALNEEVRSHFRFPTSSANTNTNKSTETDMDKEERKRHRALLPKREPKVRGSRIELLR